MTTIFGGFYLKEYISNLDSVKISLEIKSDKAEKEEASASNNNKKQNSKKLVKKPKEKKTPYDSENDYILNTQTVLNLFEDLDYEEMPYFIGLTEHLFYETTKRFRIN